MDPSKRKRTAEEHSTNGRDHRRPRRANGEERAKYSDDGGDRDHRTAAVNDAEVEEFFAIVQRMRSASRCTAVADAVRRREAEGFRWRPAFVPEDFEECGAASAADAVKDDGRGKEASSGENKEETVSVRGLELDLNADPVPEGGEHTVRCAGVRA